MRDQDRLSAAAAPRPAAAHTPRGLALAYLVNHYPKASHTFIRREIVELERQGWRVQRYALRGDDGELSCDDDRHERARTRYLLQGGARGLAAAVLQVLARRPRRLFGALRLALAMGWRGDRPLPYHLLYLAEACRLFLWMRQDGVDHLHAHFGTNPAEVAMLAAQLGGPAYSFTVHGPEEFDKPGPLQLDRKIAHAAFVVAVSSFGRSQLYRAVGHAEWHKVRVIHCGLEPAFSAGPLAPVPDVARVVCVGRLCEQKGQLLLLDAVSRLAARGIRCELVLAGDGEMRPAVEALVRRHGLGGAVRITGWIDSARVREEILAARALVLPSFAEGLPVAIMEAMALRRPVLTSWVAGIPELVTHGENGWLFAAGDVDALTDALAELLAATPAALRQMGEHGRRRVLERHAIETEVARLALCFRLAHRCQELT